MTTASDVQHTLHNLGHGRTPMRVQTVQQGNEQRQVNKVVPEYPSVVADTDYKTFSSPLLMMLTRGTAQQISTCAEHKEAITPWIDLMTQLPARWQYRHSMGSASWSTIIKGRHDRCFLLVDGPPHRLLAQDLLLSNDALRMFLNTAKANRVR